MTDVNLGPIDMRDAKSLRFAIAVANDGYFIPAWRREALERVDKMLALRIALAEKTA